MRQTLAEFKVVSGFAPTGDQPQAIRTLAQGLAAGARRFTLEGVTGSGKTFTMANVIAAWGRPAIIISHNKTLAAQLFAELKGFFPHNAVEYFVSYYDYYQPEAYIPQTDTYIEKDASINEEIERYRLGATNALLGRRDVVIVASVSCIYGLGSPEDYRTMLVEIESGKTLNRDVMLERLVDIQYSRNDYDPQPGTFRVRGDCVDIFPSYETTGIRVSFFGDDVEDIREFDPVSGKSATRLSRAVVSPAKHFVMPKEKVEAAIGLIRAELDERLAELERQNKLLEAQRLRQRTEFDLEMLRELGYCNGIENYSRHLAGRAAGEPPACLLDYFDGEFLTIIDESHVTLPQLRAMYNGDQARKQTLVEHGFRLPSAKDNRPLNFDEFLAKVGPIMFVSATPAAYERQVSEVVVEQVIRPTGLLDPPVEVRPLENQIDDLMEEVRRAAEKGDRVLVTTLTKRSAEDLTAYLRETGIRVEYLHSDIDAIQRVEILGRLRKGAFDCLVGINLLREGLDLPEVALVAVLDADKEGFLRSGTSLIQTAGRTARHLEGRVILYADTVTDAMREMMETTQARRAKQEAYNREHGITPRSVKRAINESLALYAEAQRVEARMVAAESHETYDLHRAIGELEADMLAAAEALEFERAAMLRDEIRELKRLRTAE
ncbi:MAG TPA: excinuclease ABC subunit UvrB [Kiritimatiellia bacterium]|nr:excinuclease ABC subunit UvrB [Kiritimatiellia bacterium]HRU70865.1 excinuclease ABC subunit UvrB [Kiritimatiellia bacterium]